MKVSVCIPMYNESDAVLECASQLFEKMESLSAENGYDFEIIFCDDGSTDDCRQMALSFAESHANVKVIGYDANRGKGAAVKTAVEESSGDVVIFTDCDLAYGTEVIGKAVGILYKDGDFTSDVLVGSRNTTGDGYSGYGFLRKAASKTYIKLLSLIGGLPVSDSQCGFKAFRADCAKKIFEKCECEGFAFDYEVIMIARKYGMKISEMPVKIVNHRESSVRVVRDAFSMMRDIFKIKRRVSKIKI